MRVDYPWLGRGRVCEFSSPNSVIVNISGSIVCPGLFLSSCHSSSCTSSPWSYSHVYSYRGSSQPDLRSRVQVERHDELFVTQHNSQTTSHLLQCNRTASCPIRRNRTTSRLLWCNRSTSCLLQFNRTASRPLRYNLVTSCL